MGKEWKGRERREGMGPGKGKKGNRDKKQRITCDKGRRSYLI